MLRRFRAQLRMREEAKRPQAVANADQHHPLLCQFLSTIGWNGGATDTEPATVNPYQNRDPGGGRLGRAPYIQVEAVLACRDPRDTLNALRRKFIRRPNALPLGGRLRRTPAQVAHRRRSERNTSINRQSVFDRAFQFALFNFRDRRLGPARQGECHDSDCQQKPSHLSISSRIPCRNHHGYYRAARAQGGASLS